MLASKNVTREKQLRSEVDIPSLIKRASLKEAARVPFQAALDGFSSSKRC